jgi:Protein of unknown function (DUF5818)
MRATHACVVLVAVALCAPLDAQNKKALKTVSLSGCVVQSEKTADQFTLNDAKEGTFRLSGVKLRDYLGQRVQVAGAVVENKRLTVKGGLLPNPNVAAQAGAMDPARAAVASSGGAAGPGTVDDFPEFKVKSVRPADGSCPP